MQQLLALTTAAIWHNETNQHPGPARSLTHLDHTDAQQPLELVI